MLGAQARPWTFWNMSSPLELQDCCNYSMPFNNHQFIEHLLLDTILIITPNKIPNSCPVPNWNVTTNRPWSRNDIRAKWAEPTWMWHGWEMEGSNPSSSHNGEVLETKDFTVTNGFLESCGRVWMIHDSGTTKLSLKIYSCKPLHPHFLYLWNRT